VKSTFAVFDAGAFFGVFSDSDLFFCITLNRKTVSNKKKTTNATVFILHLKP